MVKSVPSIKTEEQIAEIRKACKISSDLHLRAMMQVFAGDSELEVAELLERSRSATEAQEWAFAPLVGSGLNAVQIHALPTEKKLIDEELILIDMGVRRNGWCSDITRTWPLGPRYSTQQKVIYEIVLRAQKQVLKEIRPGETLVRLHSLACDYLLEGLLRNGVIQDQADFLKLYPHRTSHWLGRDVHDQCDYFYADGSPVKLSLGAVFTVEPGLYIPNFNRTYGGIAVRIEDVVVVTERGCEVLSLAPKEVEEIEEIRT